MRTPRWITAVTALALIAGCGDRKLVLKVDVLSYLDPADTMASFGPVPAFPGGVATGELAMVNDAQINLLAGLSDAAEVQSVTVSLSTVVVDSTGGGSDTLRVYASDPGTDPRTTLPILEQTVVMTPGATDTVTAVLDGDARLAALFAAKKMRLTVTTSLRGPASGADLNGRLWIRALDAVVIAGRKSL